MTTKSATTGRAPPDDTFGLQVVYQKTPPQLNYSPLSDYQFFGEVNVSARERTLAVTLHDVGGHALFERTLEPQS
jgi:alkaline phosphatase D